MVSRRDIKESPKNSISNIMSNEEAHYLHKTFSRPLSEGIAATIKSNPVDPIYFLSSWLLQYVTERRRLVGAGIRKALRASRIQSRALEEGAVKGSTSAQASAGNLHLTKLDNEAFRPLQEAEWIDEEVMGDLLNHLRKTLNATGVYLARYEEQAGLKNGELAPGLRYVAADNSHLHMLDQCLMEDEGITCDLLRQEEPAEATAEKSDSPEASEDEDEEAPPRNLSDVRAAFVKVPLGSIVGHLGTSLRLNTLFVEEVMDNPRIRFFGLIRPGSYAAVSLEFDNVASPASVATLFTWLEEKQGRERALISAQQSGETAHANSRESADEDTGTSFEAEVERNEGALEAGEDPLPPVQLSTTPARYILSVDFLGSETTSRLPTILRLEDFAKELGSALIKTQIKAVERQARELLQETVAVEELAQLVQNSAQKLEALQRVRQAEALERLEAEEADGARELKSSREDFFPVGKGDHGPAQNGNEQNKKDSLSDDVDAEKRVKQPEEKNSMEEEQDAPDEPLVRLPRDLVLEVARAHAALEVFNAEVLSIFKPKFTLCRKYIPDSPALVSVAAACALILGYKPEGLRKKSARGREWSWDRIRRLLDPSFVEAMLAFDPKAPRHFSDSENSLPYITELAESRNPEEETLLPSPHEKLLSSWISLALIARRKQLLLQRERIKRNAALEHTQPPQLNAPDDDFKY